VELSGSAERTGRHDGLAERLCESSAIEPNVASFVLQRRLHGAPERRHRAIVLEECHGQLRSAVSASRPDVTGGNMLMCTSGPYKNSYVDASAECDGGNSVAAFGGHANSNPAMHCYLVTMGRTA